MYKQQLIAAVMACSIVPVVAGQEIHITIPRRSELTPVQRLNRDGVDSVIKHKYNRAEALFLKAYLFDPSDPFTLNNLGYVSELQGEIDRAATYYELAAEQGCDAIIDRSSDKTLSGKPMMDALGAIKSMPMRVNRTNIYAIVLLSQNRSFEAEALLEQLLTLDPNNPFTLNNLAVAEEANGNLEEAITHYDASVRTHSRLPVVISARRSSMGSAISDVAAVSAGELRMRMASMDIKEIRAHMFAVRGVAELSQNEPAIARKDFEQSFFEDPQSSFALNNLGYLAEQDGDPESAISLYARAQRGPDAAERIGMATGSTAYGQHLASVANESRHNVGLFLRDRRNTLPPSTKAFELLRRNGTDETSEPSVPARNQEAPSHQDEVPPTQ